MTLKATDRIFVPLDTPDAAAAIDMATKLKGYVGGMKLGKEFFMANGPDAVEAVSAVGMPIFLDLKFHDIPNTVAGAVRSVLPLKPAIVNVHAVGGAAMMRAANDARAGVPSEDTLLIAVTVLTSLSDEDLTELGVNASAKDQAVRLAKLAKVNGLDGVVCSPWEIAPIRAACGDDFKLVVPGIRPSWAAAGDQKRIMTPADAVREGADYLVMGRPITAADDPVAAAERVAEELAGL